MALLLIDTPFTYLESTSLLQHNKEKIANSPNNSFFMIEYKRLINLTNVERFFRISNTQWGILGILNYSLQCTYNS